MYNKQYNTIHAVMVNNALKLDVSSFQSVE